MVGTGQLRLSQADAGTWRHPAEGGLCILQPTVAEPTDSGH
jgi:hypothetical protein